MKAIPSRKEAARLKALARYQVLDRSLQSALDQITRLAADLCQTPVAMVSFVDRDRVRLISRKGLAAKSIARKGSFCDQAIRRKDLLVVRDGRADSRFAECAWLKSKPPLRFYAGVPLLTRQGHALGALAILDRKPRNLSTKERAGLKALAWQVLALLERQRPSAAEKPASRKLRPELPARQLAEEELKKSRRLLQTIYDALPDGICLADMNFKIRSCNQAIRRILGYEPEELVGQSYALLVPAEVLSDPDHLRRQEELLEKGRLEREDYFLKRKNGEVFPASYSVALIKDDQGRPTGLVGTVRDITERKQAEEELKRSRRLLQTIYDALPYAICLADMNFTILSCNQAVPRILGYEPEELVGQSWDLVVPAELLSDPAFPRRRNEFLAKGFLEGDEYLLKKKSGETIPVSYSVALIKDDQGRPTGIVGAIRDITKRKRAEAALRESEERYRNLVETSPDAITVTDLQGKILMVNPQALKLYGTNRMDDVVGRNALKFIVPQDRERTRENLLKTLKTGRVRSLEYHIFHKDGSFYPVELNASVLRDAAGQPIGFIGTTRDITERKRAEAALRESEERYRNLVETSPDAITVTDLEGRVRMINPQGLQLYRVNRMEDVLGQNSFEYISPEVRPRAMQELQEMRQTGRVRNLEYPLLRADGSNFLGEINSTVLRNEAGEPIGLMAVTRDITERRQAEAALRESEERYRILVETSPDAITVTDLEGKILMVNEQTLRLYGATRMEEMLGRSAFELIVPADRARAAENLRKTLETGRTRSLEYQLFRRDGSLYPAELNASVLRNAAGQPIGFIGVTRDITERKRLEEARRESERFLANIFASIQDGISILDTDFNIIRVNPTMERWYAHTQPLVGKKCYQAYHERKEFCEICPSRRTLQTGEADYEIVPKRGPGGEITGWLDLYSFPLLDPARNTITGVIEYVRDITERKRLEAQVQHAQKLESLGILAGGIAHDFNNLLVSILGHAGLAQRRLPGDSPAQSNLLQIETAARRAADLTKQMLAYSGRGTFLVQPLDLSKLVEEMAHLLEVAISKKAMLNYQFASNLPAIEADATQLRQVVLNLITNASEALGESSGAITVCTGVTQADREYLSETYLDDNLPAGRYVYLEVSDSGCGMDRETQKKIFDPFFTTKFTGRGLGLAMVLGIMRGHKGAIKVSSEPGQGTTFKVLFPCSELPARKVETETLSLDGWRGQGAILVVDDEETVRLVTRAMLEEFGFTVLLAAGGREGIEIFRQHANQIVVVLLDITMPDLSGEQTYQEIMRLKPQARVILTSGYNEQEATRRFAGQGLAGFFQKPYQALSLIQKLREVLEA